MKVLYQRLAMLLFLLCTASALRAQPGLDEMQQVQQSLTQSFFSAWDCSLVLAALLAIGGVVRIYYNWQLGHPHMDMAVAGWFFAAIFMILAGAFLRGVFGI